MNNTASLILENLNNLIKELTSVKIGLMKNNVIEPKSKNGIYFGLNVNNVFIVSNDTIHVSNLLIKDYFGLGITFSVGGIKLHISGSYSPQKATRDTFYVNLTPNNPRNTFIERYDSEEYYIIDNITNTMIQIDYLDKLNNGLEVLLSDVRKLTNSEGEITREQLRNSFLKYHEFFNYL